MDVAQEFHKEFHSRRLWQTTTWLGVPILKCPMDLYVYQEILWETKPDLIVECGTHCGGSALFLATVLDAIGRGQVVTCDTDHSQVRDIVMRHDRIIPWETSSTSSVLLDWVRGRHQSQQRIMLILDSDHSKDHVLQELRLLAPFVSPGCYLVVEDTNMNGNPVLPYYGPGPREALEEYLSENPGMWNRDVHRERLMMTFNPGGYLRRN